jgi:hypothetical protein
MISNAAHLLGADGRFISRIKHKRNNFAAVIRQAPRFAVTVLEFEIRGRPADLSASIGF